MDRWDLVDAICCVFCLAMAILMSTLIVLAALEVLVE